MTKSVKKPAKATDAQAEVAGSQETQPGKDALPPWAEALYREIGRLQERQRTTDRKQAASRLLPVNHVLDELDSTMDRLWATAARLDDRLNSVLRDSNAHSAEQVAFASDITPNAELVVRLNLLLMQMVQLNDDLIAMTAAVEL